MSDNASDDPRQVLAILNSLGLVGVTAQELKAFMQELKLYRKVREREKQKWKEEIKSRILEKQYCLLPQKNLDNSNQLKENDQNKSNNRETAELVNSNLGKNKINSKKTLEITVDATQPVSFSSEVDSAKRQFSTITISSKTAKPYRCANGSSNEKKQERHTQKKRPVSAPDRLITPGLRRSRSRTRSTTSSELKRDTSAETFPPSKSFIRSKSALPDYKVNNKKLRVNNDPVALYEKYCSYWNKISFPGEKSHAKLRWAVRERMLGSEPHPKPVTAFKRSTCTSTTSARSTARSNKLISFP